MMSTENKLTAPQIRTIKDGAGKLTGAKRRAFQAQVTLDYLDGNARQAESVFGWSRKTVELGLNELRTGIECLGYFSARGRRRVEEEHPQLVEDIVALVEPQSQTDPKFQSRFKYTRMTAKAVRQALIDEKGWDMSQLPHENTIGVLLNRLGYRLRRVQKSKPIKRVAETEAIFENVHEQNEQSDQRPDSLRISIDTKAKVNIGPFSRRGCSRGKSATQAADHDFEPEHKLVPFGILDVMAGLLTIIFGASRETSDFIVDACNSGGMRTNKAMHTSPNWSSISTMVQSSPADARSSWHGCWNSPNTMAWKSSSFIIRRITANIIPSSVVGELWRRIGMAPCSIPSRLFANGRAA